MYLYVYIFNNNNICIKKNLSRFKKKKKRKKKELSYLFIMCGRICRINVMYFISCKFCEIEKKIIWYYLVLFFFSRNKLVVNSCWRVIFYMRFDIN